MMNDERREERGERREARGERREERGGKASIAARRLSTFPSRE
jgi:hypothetical protein